MARKTKNKSTARRGGGKALSMRLYAAVKRAGGVPMAAGELMHRLSLPRARKVEVRDALSDLVQAGKLARLRGSYVVPEQMGGVTGRFIGHPDGFGFVVPEGGGEDVYVPRREVKGAMHGDTVTVRVVTGRDGRTQGGALRVVTRAHATLVGRLDRWRGRWRVLPLEERFGREVWVDPKGAEQARQDDLVLVSITAYPDRGEPMAGRVLRVLGDGTDAARDSEVLLAAAGVDPQFPAAAAEDAERLPQKVLPRDREGRVDLRDLPTVTIDGEYAKDFDDAVSLVAGPDGAVTLWVHIADVDHFAPPGSELDQAARERGTSIYLPDMVVPMFPEALSNGICSLKPEVDRVTLTAEMVFDGNGHRTARRIYPSVIRSDARLTYTQVNAMLVDADAALRERFAPLLPMLEGMAALAARRQAIREARGSLDFDLPEMLIVLGEGGEIHDIVQRPRAVAERLIEEFMLAANEAVAEWLTEGEWPVVYRVHEDPDLEKLAAFVPVARNILGPDVPIPAFSGVPEPRTLQRLLKVAEGHPGEHVLNSLLVRSLKQARYTGEHLGHYGLASPCYCHFTSPIRRYPDLMVHRLVKHRLNNGEFRRLRWIGELEGTAQLASERERRAMSLERQVVAIKKCRYLARHVGDVLDGVVSSVARFGLFVELSVVGHEGLVHADQLPKPVVHDERHMALFIGRGGRHLGIGDPVRVEVLHVDVLAAKVSLALADDI